MSRVALRLRVTAAFVAASALVLAALGLFLHDRLADHLDEALGDALRSRGGDLVVLAKGEGLAGLGRSSLDDPGDDIAQVLDATGRVVVGAPGFEDAPLLSGAETRRALRGPLELGRRDVGSKDGPARLLAAPAGRRVVVAGASLDDRDDTLASLRGLLLLGLPAALLAAGLAGYLVAGRALAPMDRLRRRADELGDAAGLAQRLPVPAADDEVRALAVTLNAMLGRLEAAFAHERAFVADASHELRTPLARLKAELELALRPGRDAGELRSAVASAAEEVDRLAALAEDLLVIARADQGGVPIRHEPLDAAQLLAAVARRAGLGVEVDAPAGLTFDGDRLRLEQALGNLVENGLRHGAPPITLSARTDGDEVVLTVRDHGPGIPAELRDRAFERFTRADAARGADGGAGLGLAIVAAIAQAHGGSAGAGEGAELWLRLPLRSG